MKITTKKTTVRDLLAILATATDENEEVTFGKAPKTKNACFCGCGGLTGGRFVPGHDSKFHSLAKQVARGQADLDESLAGLPHDEAVAEFEHHVAVELPKAKARREEKAAKVAAREAAKAAKAAEKDAPAEAEIVAATPLSDEERDELLAEVTQAD